MGWRIHVCVELEMEFIACKPARLSRTWFRILNDGLGFPELSLQVFLCVFVIGNCNYLKLDAKVCINTKITEVTMFVHSQTGGGCNCTPPPPPTKESSVCNVTCFHYSDSE